ncbi:MAG: ATP-binding cassette domain-containing protein [Candidatus Hydrothermarchaeales archaeon]
MEDAIKTKGLTKKFEDLIAVNRVSLTIRKGELFGLLGPNGAGKTTFISMLCTIINSSAGEGEVWGFDIEGEAEKVRKAIGIVFQDPSLDEQLTGRENLDFHGRLYGLEKELRSERIDEVLKLVELEVNADNLVKTYSGGMRRRLEIARGLMHRPKVLFLDEPTLGLDPQTRRRIWDYILKLNKEEHVTILLTTHYMDEADFLCDRIGIIDYGKIIALGTPEELKKAVRGDVVTLNVQDGSKLLKVLEDKSWIKELKVVDDGINLSVDDGEGLIPKIIELARERNIVVDSVGLRKPTLEDVFIHYTGRSIREEKGSHKDKIKAILRARRRR